MLLPVATKQTNQDLDRIFYFEKHMLALRSYVAGLAQNSVSGLNPLPQKV